MGDEIPSLRTIQRWMKDANEAMTVEISDAARLDLAVDCKSF